MLKETSLIRHIETDWKISFGMRIKLVMAKKKQIIIAAVFMVVLLIVGGMAFFLNQNQFQAGKKHITFEVISDRDGYEQKDSCQTKAETLADFLSEQDDIEYENGDYGMFITGVRGMEQDQTQQYWWCITVNHEEVSSGADQIALEDGSTYTLTLLKGY